MKSPLMKSPLKAYTDNQYGHRASSHNVLEQTNLLYQLLLDDLDQCRGCIERGELNARTEKINHATRVLSALAELALASAPVKPSNTDDSQNPPLSDLLTEMYNHCLLLISTVIVVKDKEKNIASLNEAWSMINHVKSSWDQLALKSSTSTPSLAN